MKNSKGNKKHSILGKITAAILALVLCFTALPVTSPKNAKAAGYNEAALKTVTSLLGKGFGYCKDTMLKTIGSEFAKMGFGFIMENVLGIDYKGPSNSEVIDNIDKRAEEIKQEIAKVLNAVNELSDRTNTYHSLEMNQLKAINSNIDSKDFRTQADIVAGDFAHALKRINEHKDNFTTDGSGKINNTTYKAYKEILNDSKCNISNLQYNFDEMLRFLKGERTSNNNEKGYQQLTRYLLDKVVAADLNEHSYSKTPDYLAAINGIEAEIRTMEEHALLDYAIINVLNNMAYRVKEYEIDNNIITVNSDELPFAKYENVANDLYASMIEMNNIFTATLNENSNLEAAYVHAILNVYDGGETITKGCKSFMDAYSQGIESGKDFEVVCTDNTSAIHADPAKGFMFDANIKGVNSKGEFVIPAGRKITLDMRGWSNGFYLDGRKDINIFVVYDSADFTLRSANLKGGSCNIIVPDNQHNVRITGYSIDFYECENSAIYIAAKAVNANIKLSYCEFWYQCKKDITSNWTTSVSENSCHHLNEKEERGNEYWGT